jgi:hypothetical protein
MPQRRNGAFYTRCRSAATAGRQCRAQEARRTGEPSLEVASFAGWTRAKGGTQIATWIAPPPSERGCFIGTNQNAGRRACSAASTRSAPCSRASPPLWRSGGRPAEVVEQLKVFEAAGAGRFMLQQNDLDDLDALELLASEVLPRVA